MAKILIVEDNDLNFELANELLNTARHKVIWAKDEKECFTALSQEKPDLILMDIGLPGKDGLSITKKLKADSKYKRIPIVAFTAMVMKEDRKNALESGCDGFIPKPIEVSSFVTTVESYIGRERKAHKILAIDDNVMNTEIIAEVMASENQCVTTASSGKEALELIEKEKFDLVLLDIMMPDMSGFDVIIQLKSNPATANLPVIFISALDNTESIVKGFNLGSYEYIVKPYKIAELKARILNILKIKDLQDELQAEKRVFDIISEFSADGIVLLNSQLEMISCNKIFLEWIEKNEKEVLNKKFCDIINCSNEICIEKNQDNYFHFHYKTLGQNKKILGINRTRVMNAKGGTDGYVLILRDITAQAEIEAQKETFVATLTHDLKTPVRAQIKALEMLLAGNFGELKDMQAEIITETLNSNKYMSYMLDNLLSTYKYENGNAELNKQEIDINSLIKSSFAELKYIAEDKQQEILFEFKEKNLNIVADPIEIKRVVNNLLSNAINYTNENGKIWIKTCKLGDDAVLSFIDSGKGISKEEIKSLFNKFTSHAKRFRQVGTGLGLYLSKHIVEMHGGKISVESEEGKGSCFTVMFPIN